MQALGMTPMIYMHHIKGIYTIHFPCYITLCNKAITIFLSVPRIHSHPPLLRNLVKCPMLRLTRRLSTHPLRGVSPH